MELISHGEDNVWVIKLTESETAQLKINGADYGQVYAVGSTREAILTLRIEEADAV